VRDFHATRLSAGQVPLDLLTAARRVVDRGRRCSPAKEIRVGVQLRARYLV
jgi:hypothetical protein